MHFNIADWFIVERLLAALCGMLFQVDDEKLTLEIADHVEETFFKNVPTTHVLILDYADTILDYIANKYGYERTIDAIETEQLQEWQLDEACIKTIQDDDQVEVLGYGPISRDFAKYMIGYGPMYRGYDLGETSPLKKGISAIIWQMKQLGYSEELFEQLDKEIQEKNYHNYNVDNTGYVERYGKKYSWIAFFELYGYAMLHDICEPEYDNGIRTSHINIDPTFPQKPPKIQLIMDFHYDHYGIDYLINIF